MVVGELAHTRQLIILGGGPGGYHTAIRAAQLGLEVTLIEKESLGGVCLNKGCIPSKMFCQSGKKMKDLQNLKLFGIHTSTNIFDMELFQSNKANVIDGLREGIKKLCSANQIEVVRGSASFLSDDRVAVEAENSYEVYRFDYAVIATGANIINPYESERILDFSELYQLKTIPERLVVNGNSLYHLETAIAFRNLGSKVSIVLESDKGFGFDSSIEKEVIRLLKKMKIQLLHVNSVEEIECVNHSVVLTALKNDERISLETDYILISHIHSPNIEDLRLQSLGLEFNDDHFIKVDSCGRTKVPNIFAVGDVVEGPKSATLAIKQGKVAAETIAGVKSEVDIRFLPRVVHSTPQIATVGLSEEEARDMYDQVRVSQFPLTANGFSAITGQKEGFVKVISEKESERILGIHCIGEGAIELISSGIISSEMVAREEDLKFPFYPHPSFNEGLLEAVEGLANQAIHVPPKKRTNVIREGLTK
ncbi:FAD-dependent oxidoreductase [Bacillus timonensis]|nr:FAD-dependent oxidoreductase [Bacillus timonensis]